MASGELDPNGHHGSFRPDKGARLRPARIASVRVGLSKTVYDMHGTLAWNDKFKALLSTPYVTAIVLHDRRCWLDQFEPARFRDPAVDAFARERVKVEIDPRVEGPAPRSRSGASTAPCTPTAAPHPRATLPTR